MRNVITAFLVGSFAALTSTATAATLYGGTTTVDFDPAFINTVVGAGFTVAAVPPGTLNLTSSPAMASFPITGGDSTMMIDHSGGLTFSLNGTNASIENFVISVPNSLLTGQVVVGSTTLMNVSLFDISKNATLTIDPTLGSALAADFHIPNLSGATVGTAVIAPVTTPEPASMALSGVGLLAAMGLFIKRKRA